MQAACLTRTISFPRDNRRFSCSFALIALIWAACAAGGRRGLLGAVPLRGSLYTPPGSPLWAFRIPLPGEGCAAFAAGASSLRSVISLRAAQCHRAFLRCMCGWGVRGVMGWVVEKIRVWALEWVCYRHGPGGRVALLRQVSEAPMRTAQLCKELRRMTPSSVLKCKRDLDDS